jgi:hypothetical protein
MAAYKYTAKYGSTDRGQILVGAGDAEAQGDTISINIDVTNMSRGEAMKIIEKIQQKIMAEPWPPLP